MMKTTPSKHLKFVESEQVPEKYKIDIYFR